MWSGSLRARFPAGEARRRAGLVRRGGSRRRRHRHRQGLAATRGHDEGGRDLTVKGHTLRVPHATMGAARFRFHDLCEQPLAASDYLRIAREFHTVVLDRIRRWTTAAAARPALHVLIDTFYDNAVKLVASAAAEPDGLFRGERRLRGAKLRGAGVGCLAPDRDALGRLSGAAPRPARPRPRAGWSRGSWRRECGTPRPQKAGLPSSARHHCNGLNASAERVNHAARPLRRPARRDHSPHGAFQDCTDRRRPDRQRLRPISSASRSSATS